MARRRCRTKEDVRYRARRSILVSGGTFLTLQIFIIVGTIGVSIAGGSLGVSVYGVIIFWRFIMVVGIGGDYPVSSVITSEFAARKIRGRMMAAVFSAQGWGNREYIHRQAVRNNADFQSRPE